MTSQLPTHSVLGRIRVERFTRFLSMICKPVIRSSLTRTVSNYPIYLVRAHRNELCCC